MAENQTILSKMLQAGEAALDSYLAKAKSNIKKDEDDQLYDRRGMLTLDDSSEQQAGWIEKRGLVGPEMLKNMARKDSIIVAIRRTRISQTGLFSKYQKDRYSPGWIINPKKPADISEDDKLSLADPSIINDDEAREALKFELDKKRAKLLQAQEKDIEKIKQFIAHCGSDSEDASGHEGRFDFPKLMSVMVDDRLTYNYCAIEIIPTKDRSSISCFYPVSAGTIRYATKNSSKRYKEMLKKQFAAEGKEFYDDGKDFKYVQVVRGRVVAAWTEDQLIFEAAMPTVDPEDMGYSPGELEQLIQIITAHLYAEAHNRNFFTQGLGTKGILHIKGENVNRAQLEAFKRQWFNQVVNTRNAFRPPIIGIADDVKWVELAQSNKDMEFDNWMHYLIRICCAVFQIDPAEINFDISKVSSSTLNESNNEEKIKSSKDKGLKPLLDYIENIMNNEILRRWDKKLADKYEFKFVGLDAESRKEEMERLKGETQTWKTINEARIEMGKAPIEDGDIILAAAYTQYKQMKDQAQKEQQGMGDEQAGQEAEQMNQDADQNAQDLEADNQKYVSDLNSAIEQAHAGIENDKKQQEKKDLINEKEKAKAENTKKSVTIQFEDNEDE